MFDRVLIANRGEIAGRVIRTCRRLGIGTVAVYSEADHGARHVALADEARLIGPPPVRESYLNIDAILDAARRSGAEAVHPGYGFLAENAAFARACAEAGIVFIGPPPEAIEAMGAKDRAKAIMAEAGVPLVPGYHGEDQDPRALLAAAEGIGWPVLLKAAAGGGGKAMRVVDGPEAFAPALEGVRREAASSFGDDRVLLEAYVRRPRHVEVQVLADAHGQAVHMFERDCSLQRRHQKVVEEAPAPGLTTERRDALGEIGVRAAKGIGYVNAGTVECLMDEGGRFFFIEMNTRLQVEHPVTEMITGVDLVEWQLRIAAGEPLGFGQDELRARGHAIEARVYAEDPARGFLPSTGRLHHLRLPAEEAGRLRVETGVREGDEVTPYYDPMLAKLVAWGPDRPAALRRLRAAVADTEAVGVATNLDFLARALDHPAFVAGGIDTGFLDRAGAELLPPAGPVDDEILALACLALLLERAAAAADAARRGADPYSPWHRVDGWRLNGRAYQTLHLRDGERAIAVDAQAEGGGSWLLDLPGGRVAASGAIEPDRRLRAEVGGVVRHATVIRRGDDLHVFVGGRHAGVTVWDPDALAATEEGADGLLTTPLPGRVARVLAAEGETVEKGGGLLIIEAMKMEHTVTAPGRGRVAALRYREGDRVEEGAVLLDFEPAPEAGEA